MKSLLLSLVLLLLVVSPIIAEEATVSASPSPTPEVMGLYDEELDSTVSATPTPTPSPTATASARTTTYLDPTDAPVSGSVENTIIILALGVIFITAGIRFSRE